MSGERWHTVLRHLRRPRAADEAAGLADTDLLRRWAAGRDEAAFELLVWRHGPMVLAVCRRLLRHAEDVEDAFQATFLVLARKAGAVRRGEAVAGWLYRVAYRVALQARARAGRRPAHAPQALDQLPAGPDPGPADGELRAVLDQEVGRLPERYRLPFVLCYTAAPRVFPIKTG
jgi:RNA polymerase sigma factor (sigma-70 family)